MRNFCVLITSCILILLGSCSNNDNRAVVPSVTTHDTLDQGAKRFADREKLRLQKADDFRANSNTFDKIVESFGITEKSTKEAILSAPIDSTLAALYINNFSTPTTAQTTPPRTSVLLTRSVWVNKDAIIDIAKALQDPKSGVDGLRIYFAKYPSRDLIGIDPMLDPDLHDRNTLIFVATKDSSGNHMDFFDTSHREGFNGLYIYDYNNLCPDICLGAKFDPKK